MNRFTTITLLVSLVAAPTAMAEVSDEEFELMREQITLMSLRLDQLAAENAELRQAQTQAMDPFVPPDSWPERIRLGGDFRYRYETLETEGEDKRSRNRIRARTNITADASDDVEVGFGIATGGDSPVSTNQTLGGGGSSKSINLNLAYVDWEATDGLHLLAGKYKNPLTRVGGQALMWDSDWTPEGLALKYKGDWLFVNAFGSFLESDSKDNNDSFAWGTQFGASGTLGSVSLSGGIAYYDIEAQGKQTSFGDTSDPDDYYGNTAVEASGVACGTNPGTECEYLYDYVLTEVFAEASFELGSWPVRVFADYVSNSAAPVNDIGWSVGTKVGQTRNHGQMQFGYIYTDKGADSMLALVTDSDFAGGGTDGKGHLLEFYYGVNESWTIGAQYFINEIDLASGSPRDFDRLMIDMQWKWK